MDITFTQLNARLPVGVTFSIVGGKVVLTSNVDAATLDTNGFTYLMDLLMNTAVAAQNDANEVISVANAALPDGATPTPLIAGYNNSAGGVVQVDGNGNSFFNKTSTLSAKVVINSSISDVLPQ
jgi:hypothetical protein